MRRLQKTSLKSISILFASVSMLAATSMIAANVAGAAPQTKLIAKSNALDPAAKQITRTVANETLRSISTKDNETSSGHGLIVERLEDDGPIVLPPKIVSEPAPGTQAEDREPAAEVASAPVADAQKHEDEAKVEEPKHDEPIAASPPKTAMTKHGKAAENVLPEKALQWLQNGNKRYLKKANRADGKSQADRDRLSKGQHPHAIVLSCADSRVPPETVFDQSLGEIFVVRTAGESLDSSVIASLEYAVEHLGPRLLVVMGHTSCGAVTAAIATKDGESAGSPALDALVADIKPRLPNRGPAGLSSQAVEIESAANAQGVAADLIKRSSIIRDRVEKGDLVIKPALYYLDSGVVKFY
jgi:carbonic anhydrase